MSIFVILCQYCKMRNISIKYSMDPVANPYSPGAGTPPPELVGRDELRDTGRIAIERVRRGRPTKSLLMVGLRGVGKTVLLDSSGMRLKNRVFRRCESKRRKAVRYLRC